MGKEAIDQMNGLLLLPNLDKAFDRGLISFENNGKIIISSQLDGDAARALGIHIEMRISRILSYHHSFLEFHRRNIFKGNAI
jgi:5-methylcytosine-specific restriction protein A